ncbi:MAG: ABC transporter permease [bacterium]|nr:MAG: ABC transporter permease [bacterium]
MNWRVIQALIVNDYKAFFRDKFFGIMTIVGLILFILFYFVMPARINETITIGLYSPYAAYLFDNIPEGGGAIFHTVESEDELKRSVIDNEFYVGISIPEDVWASYLSGKRPHIYVFYSADIPDEAKEMNTVLIGEMINELSGNAIEVEEVEIVLGPDMAGRQIPYRDRLLPLLVFMLMITEVIGLSNLITYELQTGTIEALLATPMRIIDFFAGKGLTGISLAFSQIFLLMMITRSLTHHAGLIVVALLLGVMMVTGIAFLIASVSKDMVSVIGWGTLVLIVLVIPAVTVVFRAPVSSWIKILPSYFLVDILHKAINFNIGWSGNVRNILPLAGFDIVFVCLGIVILKRKVR